MNFLQEREWGLMILDGELSHDCHMIPHMTQYFVYLTEVQTCPADKFRRTLSGKQQFE